MTKNKKWTKEDIPDLTNKVVIVTGANSGTGYEGTKEFVSKNATVIMGCRDLNKAEIAKFKLLNLFPKASIDIIVLDLANLQSIKDFANKFNSKYSTLDILCNNAGIMQTPNLKTINGFELQFGTNHLGHFALTGLLLKVLLRTANSRVVTMSSWTHIYGKINFDNLNYEKPKSFKSTRAYAQSKLANLLFSFEFHRKIEQKGLKIMSLASHPGYSATNLQSTGLKIEKGIRNKLWRWGYKIGNKVFAHSAEKGVLPMLMAATSSDAKGGEFYGPSTRLFIFRRSQPKVVKAKKKAYNLETAKLLWDVSEELTGITYNF